MNKNNYSLIDNGLLTPLFNTYLIQPLLKKLPSYITPNLITLLSFLFSTLGLISTLYFGHTPMGVYFTSFFQFLYVLTNQLNIATLQNPSTLRSFLNQFQTIYAVGTIHFSIFHFFQVSTPFILIFSLTLNYLYLCKKFDQLYQTGVVILPKISSWEQILILHAANFLSLHPVLHQIFCDFVEVILFLSISVNIVVFRKEILSALIEKWQFGLYFLILLSFHYVLPDFYKHHIIFFIVLYNLHFIGSVIANHLTSATYPMPDLIAPPILLLGPSTTLTYGFATSFLGARVCCLVLKTVAKILKDEKI